MKSPLALAASVKHRAIRYGVPLLQQAGLDACLPPEHRTTQGKLRHYSSLCRKAGIDRLYLLLSFDCDTKEDAVASRDLFPLLQSLQIPATFAVPGVTLKQTAEIYSKLAQQGAHFINHGGLPHAEMQGDRYASITFYHEMSDAEVVADIEHGDACVREVTGFAPAGFRAPHFGYYQKPEQMKLVYDTAKRLGYRFCTTTLPKNGLEHGAAYRAGQGIIEFPLNGSLSDPQVILDSWNYLTDTKHYHLSENYFLHFKETVDFFLREALPGVLNYYVDPAHVAGQPPFQKALEYARGKQIPALSYEQLLPLCAV